MPSSQQLVVIILHIDLLQTDQHRACVCYSLYTCSAEQTLTQCVDRLRHRKRKNSGGVMEDAVDASPRLVSTITVVSVCLGT